MSHENNFKRKKHKQGFFLQHYTTLVLQREMHLAKLRLTKRYCLAEHNPTFPKLPLPRTFMKEKSLSCTRFFLELSEASGSLPLEDGVLSARPMNQFQTVGKLICDVTTQSIQLTILIWRKTNTCGQRLKNEVCVMLKSLSVKLYSEHTLCFLLLSTSSFPISFRISAICFSLIPQDFETFCAHLL